MDLTARKLRCVVFLTKNNWKIRKWQEKMSLNKNENEKMKVCFAWLLDAQTIK